MDVRVYKPPISGFPTFVSSGRITEATNASVVERLYSPGHFDVECPIGARHAEKLAVGRLVYLDGFWGLIDDIKFSANSDGSKLIVSGRQLKGLTADRITIPPAFSAVTGAQGYDTATGTTEAIIKHFVAGNMRNAAQPDRIVYGLEIAPDLGRGTANDRYMSRHDPLDDVLATLGEAAGLGYDISPDLKNHKLIFDVVAGVDHSAQQKDRMRVIFDIARKTALSQEYINNTSDSRNVFYATMSGSDMADETLTSTYTRDGEETKQGISRREKHLIISTDTPTAGAEYAELKQKVLSEAESFKAAESFSCEIAEGQYQYRRDYNLGDLVSVVNHEMGLTMHSRVTEMATTYGSDGVRRTATFGTAAINVFGRLKRQIEKGA